ncbi:acyltransferase [Ralstonia pickettii]|nr:acyltransferase [Ralstonia pickettii]
MSRTGKLESIQALRAFAALYVFIFHTKAPLPLWSPESSAAWMDFVRRGFMGVDLFFVISGFIMAWVCVLSGRSNDGPVGFGVKRIFRIVPPYWLSTVVVLYVLGQNTIHDDLRTSLLFMPLDLTPAPFYGYAVHGLGWTLNYEMLFYGIFSIALFFGRFALIAVVLAICALVFAVPLLLGAPISFDTYRVLDFKEPYFRMATNPMMLEFALGIGAAVSYKALRGRLNRSAVIAVLIAGAAWMAWRMAAYNGIHSPLFVGMPAALLVLGAALAEAEGLISVPKRAVWLGEISFAFYLVHSIVLQWLNKNMPAPVGTGATYGKLLFDFGAVLVASYYWYRFIEAPFMELGTRIARVLRGRSLGDGVHTGLPSGESR